MRRWILSATLLVGLCAAASAQQVEVEEFTLDNGMTFLLVPRQDQPNIIAAGWLAKVGSVDERPGITGLAHFFEHMMFKGTTTIGTRDAEADKRFTQRQQEVHEQLMALQHGVQFERWKRGEIDDPWNPRNDTPEMAKLRAELKSLMDEHGAEIVTNEFDRVYTTMGASGMNAFTSYDLTFYFINVPSNRFELWAWMESDRLYDSVFREFYTERDVVHEERRLRVEATPTGRLDEQFDAMFWVSSPYKWPVIGWPSDITSYTREQAEEFYATYYVPNNLVGVVVGDFEPSEVREQITRYFSRLKPGPTPPPVVTSEMPSLAEKRMYGECDCQPQIRIRYHAVPFMHADSYPLSVMSEILNGRTGRLYRAMVEGDEVASSASAGVDARKYAGAFEFRAETKGDATPQDIEKVWARVLAELQENPVTDRELQKVKNQIAADSYRRLQSNFFLLVQLGYFEGLGSWEELNEGPRRLQEVTAEDIQRVANTYFDRSNRSVAVYTRREGTTIDPMLAAIPAEMRPMVQQQLAQIAAVNDPAALREGLNRMRSMPASQLPPEYAPVMEYIAKKIEERIAELEDAE
ncbi:MAG: insulinase family protein [Phycisphaerales bacterium]|nr:MAG: insulinase family protein [Phycisphaerales bacterium]